jgi:hypothetical protein
MAKRPSRSEADEATGQSTSQKRPRVRTPRELGPDTVAGGEPDPAKPGEISSRPEAISGTRERPRAQVQQSPGDAVAARAEPRSEREPSEDEIRLRAYMLYLERGGSHGSDFEDWLRAEEELRRGR